MSNDLLNHIEELHTTALGMIRIKKNLSLTTDDVVGWCKASIQLANATITRKGKNWYVMVGNDRIAINAYSYTIITAHRQKHKG